MPEPDPNIAEPDPMDSVSELRRKRPIEFPRQRPPVVPADEQTPAMNVWKLALYFLALCIALSAIAYWLVHL